MSVSRGKESIPPCKQKLSACNSGVIVNKRGFDVIILKLLRLFLDHHLNQSEIEMEYSAPRYTMQLVSPRF